MREPSVDVAAGKAARLFQLVEALGVACGYERSFKMAERTVLANRFLLGINLADLGPERSLQVCRQLGMPAEYLASFRTHLPEANLVFLGFEDNERDCLYKVYLEFWEKVKRDVRRGAHAQEPVLLHLGFKWNTADSAQGAVSRYLCYPMLSVETIFGRLSEIYRGQDDNASLQIARELISLAVARTAGSPFIYVEVSEDGNRRRSFDINLYKAGLRLREVAAALAKMREHYSIPAERFERLYQLVADKRFGHLAGGLGRDGKDFLTVYYEM